MAPLLGRKPYPLIKPIAERPGPGEDVYIIEHTKEAFRNKEEYEARLQKYSERIWTCKSTGSSQLTHKEAWEEEQEVTELLKEEYPAWFEKPVLEIVHHNTVSLDKLVDQAWLEILTKYAVDEECDFLVGKEKSLRVKVVKVHPLEKSEEETPEKKLDGACDSPSSDKENASQENQKKDSSKEEDGKRESLCERARRSPRKLPTNLKEEKKKWVMPKFLPHKYDVKLINEDKVISNVPVDSLFRTERPPNKEIMRYFIRHTALRLGTGESSPWVVEDELVKKYSLPSKFSDFLLDPHKYFAENPTAKRRSLSTSEAKASKRQKMAGGDAGVMNEGGEKLKKKKKAPLSTQLSPTIWGHVQIKKMNGSPLKVKNSGTPKKFGDGGEAGDVILLTPGFQKGPKSSKKQGDKKQSEPKKSRKSGVRNSSNQKTKKDGKGVKSPKMKQMTLLDVAKNRSSVSPKKKARSTQGTPKLGKPLPPMALHLLRYYKENKGKEDKKSALSSLISKAAKVLTPEDRGRLPEEVRVMVQKRWELLEQKRRWAAMSEEERQDELRRKREELKEKLREKAKERREKEMLVRREQQRRYEDQELEGKSLPNFRLVDMAEGIPNTLFGDVAMVADFLNCYSDLLMPDDQYTVTAAGLMEALGTERGGFFYLNRVLVILLQTLLQDELAEGYRELDMALSDIPLTMHSASELVRLCLRPQDACADGSTSEDSADPDPDDAVSTEILEKLETSEVFELSPQEKAVLLVALCHRILMTYSVEDHVEAMQQRSAELWKERLATLKEVNDRKRAEKQKRKEEMEAKGASAGWVKLEGGGGSAPVSSGKADKKKEGGGKKDPPKAKSLPPPAESEPDDLISTVKSRRLQTIQAKKEKEEQERINKERMVKEAEEERVRKQKAAAERTFQEGIRKAKLVLRRVPLGTDRNHNRYWLFSDVVPGLYIEKGWVHESINYSFTPSPEEVKEEPSVEEEKEEEECDVDEVAQTSPQAAPQSSVETSVPKHGQNLWFVCDTTRELEELMGSLHPQGVRESELKSRLQYRYQDILRSICLARKPNLGLKTCDGQQELLKYLRSDIMEVASRLQKGGLGYMDDISEFEEKVRSLENLKDFGECVITLQESVIKKFLQGFMAPKQKKKRKQAGEESSKAEEPDEEKKLSEEARVATAVERWKTAIREAQTFSRMHVLLGMLDACIKWDLSAENARCKVCRKKGEDDKLILCDECNKPFHLFCLRPVLYSIPDGEWLCPACLPAGARRCSRGRNYKEESEEEEDSEEESEEEEDDPQEEEEEEDDDFKPIGHSLRPRKATKGKQSSSRSKQPSRAAAKKQLPRGGRARASAGSLAEPEEPVRQSSRMGGRRHNVELEKCEDVLQKLIKYRCSWPFREPVSPEEAEDYLDIISHPMDFQTMLQKFAEGQYRHSSDFLEDMKLVFSNAEEYNQPGSVVLSCMAKTEQTFVELLHRMVPGLSYLRRRPRRRQGRVEEAARGAGRTARRGEEEEEQDEEPPGRQTRRGRVARLACEESDSEEEEEEEVRSRRTGRRAVAAAHRDEREPESDGERKAGRPRRGARCGPEGRRPSPLKRGEAEEESSEEDKASQRHSKRQKLLT
uniref:Tyrosine-protein kinase BAZ1B n=1 Tax=Paramormyrops kingsleyae TaxID=1676925 RepID=A0A3B3T2L4_9TELE|nr:tyrosine-protein kinase BAZ1B [Paramormyrops kingsleyae]XP_023675245.1 tyrosine-protein kinase BAZ1B [Paramormyrops kingsleyae]XP_023675246.1 tyrosine-protein kinase BAZ1B [Paramormyrops kingsleyae]